ncbi:MAG TPA: sensor histidine kinase [Chloroflexota bacterium]|nr:sensor histidine kinase [Chloroflexota bacterium]
MAQTLHGVRPTRWLIVPWLALVYAWGLHSGSPTVRDMPLPGPLPVVAVLQPDRLFTLLLLLHAALYGVSLVVALPRRGLIAYVGAQGLLLLIMGVAFSTWNLVMALTLALAIDAILLLQRPRPVVTAVGVYLALFLLAYALQLARGAANGDGAGVVLLVVGIASFVVLYGQRAHAYERSQALVSDLEGAHAQLAASAARIEELTLQSERQRIARELHDTLTQGLAGLIMQLEAADARLADQDTGRAREIVQQAMVRARSAFTAARYVIEGLREEAPGQESVISTVQEEIARFSAETAVACESDLKGLAHLPPSLYDPILRVIGEGLVNIARHAQARHAWIRVARNARTVEVEVRDDGVGFDPAAVGARGRYGLLGLQERTRLAGGILDVRSGPDGGVALRLSLPCASAAETASRADQWRT